MHFYSKPKNLSRLCQNDTTMLSTDPLEALSLATKSSAYGAPRQQRSDCRGTCRFQSNTKASDRFTELTQRYPHCNQASGQLPFSRSPHKYFGPHSSILIHSHLGQLPGAQWMEPDFSLRPLT